MESALWALNLVAVCVACIWALREDQPPKQPPNEPANQPQAAPGRNPSARK
jgi:hypothetical protein